MTCRSERSSDLIVNSDSLTYACLLIIIEHSDTNMSSTVSIYQRLTYKTRIWANAQRDGRPAEYRWRLLFNAAVWLTPTTRLPCSNAAKTRNPLNLPGVLQTNETISATSGPKFTILWGRVEDIAA